MVSEHQIYINRLVKGGLLFAIFGFYGYLTTFLFKLFVARHYGPFNFGLLVLAQTIIGISTIIAGLGIYDGITRYLPYYKTRKDFESLSGYLEFIFKVPLIFSMISSILIFLFSKFITIFFDFPMEFLTISKIVAIILPLKIMSVIFQKLFLAEHKPLYTVLSYHIINTTLLFLLALLMMFLQLPIVFIVGAILLAQLVTLLFNVFIYKLKIRLPITKIKKFFIKDWLYFSLPLLFTGFFIYIISWSDNLIIAYFLKPTQLAIYSLSYSLAIFSGFFQSAFSHMFLPIISESYAKKRINEITLLFKSLAAWTFGLTFPFFLVLIIFSKQILMLFYGVRFSSGSTTLIIVAVGTLINISTGPNKEILMLHKKTKFLFLVNLLIALLNITLNLIFIPLWGITGAAITSSVSIAFQNIIPLWKASQCQQLKFNWIYNIKFILAGLPSVFLALISFRLIHNKLLALVVGGVLYLIFYIFILVILKTPTEEDIRLLLIIEKKLGLNLNFIKNIFKKYVM